LDFTDFKGRIFSTHLFWIPESREIQVRGDQVSTTEKLAKSVSRFPQFCEEDVSAEAYPRFQHFDDEGHYLCQETLKISQALRLLGTRETKERQPMRKSLQSGKELHDATDQKGKTWGKGLGSTRRTHQIFFCPYTFVT